MLHPHSGGVANDRLCGISSHKPKQSFECSLTPAVVQRSRHVGAIDRIAQNFTFCKKRGKVISLHFLTHPELALIPDKSTEEVSLSAFFDG